MATGPRTLRKGSLLAVLFALIWLQVLEAGAIAAEGLITIQSHYDPKETMQRLEAAVKAKGFAVFAHIDHSAQAAQVSLNLPPTDLLIFGNPKGGTPLMRANQTIGIDLPLKALVGKTRKVRHGCRTMIRNGSCNGTAALQELRIRFAPFPMRSRRLPQVQHRQSKGLPTLELDPKAQRMRFEPSLWSPESSDTSERDHRRRL